jgi:hypothetical protein
MEETSHAALGTSEAFLPLVPHLNLFGARNWSHDANNDKSTLLLSRGADGAAATPGHFGTVADRRVTALQDTRSYIRRWNRTRWR